MPAVDEHGNYGGHQFMPDRNPPTAPPKVFGVELKDLPILSAGTTIGAAFGAAKNTKDIYNKLTAGSKGDGAQTMAELQAQMQRALDQKRETAERARRHQADIDDLIVTKLGSRINYPDWVKNRTQRSQYNAAIRNENDGYVSGAPDGRFKRPSTTADTAVTGGGLTGTTTSQGAGGTGSTPGGGLSGTSTSGGLRPQQPHIIPSTPTGGGAVSGNMPPAPGVVTMGGGLKKENRQRGAQSARDARAARNVAGEGHIGLDSYNKRQYDALFAEEAYEPLDKRKKTIGGYTYDAEMSKNNLAVYHNKKNNKTYVSYRGSADLDDVSNWGQTLDGKMDTVDRTKWALKHYDRVAKKYGNNPRTTGHSLGGNLSAWVVQNRENARGAGFNQASSLWGTDAEHAKKVAAGHSSGDRFDTHRISGDAASWATQYTKTTKNHYTYKRNKGATTAKELLYTVNPVQNHLMENFLQGSDFWTQAKAWGAKRAEIERLAKLAQKPTTTPSSLQAALQRTLARKSAVKKRRRRGR